jgi:alpha-L-arabinofuranosidase
VTLDGSQTSWAEVAVTITPTESASSTSNNFTISIPNAAGETINFAMFSLFPPTFKNRQNGMGIDIAETLAVAKPAFFRFPGGKNLVRSFSVRPI